MRRGKLEQLSESAFYNDLVITMEYHCVEHSKSPSFGFFWFNLSNSFRILISRPRISSGFLYFVNKNVRSQLRSRFYSYATACLSAIWCSFSSSQAHRIFCSIFCLLSWLLFPVCCRQLPAGKFRLGMEDCGFSTGIPLAHLSSRKLAWLWQDYCSARFH